MALGGILIGFFIAANHHWDHWADLFLLSLGIIVLAFGIYVFLQYYVSWLPSLPEPRHQTAQSDSNEELEARTRACVDALGRLFAEQARYQPSMWDETEEMGVGSHKAWVKQTNRNQQHEQSIVGQFFEQHYSEVMAIAAELHNRGALTDDEARNLNSMIGSSTRGTAHGLTDIGQTLLHGVNRLVSASE